MESKMTQLRGLVVTPFSTLTLKVYFGWKRLCQFFCISCGHPHPTLFGHCCWWMDGKADIRIAFLNSGTDIQKSLKNGTDKQKSCNKEESDMTDRQEETKSLDIETKTKLDLNICQEHGCVVFITKY